MENTKIIQLKKAVKEISGFDVKRFIIIASGDLPDGRQRDTVAFEGSISEIAVTVAMNMIADQDTRKIILKPPLPKGRMTAQAVEGFSSKFTILSCISE